MILINHRQLNTIFQLRVSEYFRYGSGEVKNSEVCLELILTKCRLHGYKPLAIIIAAIFLADWISQNIIAVMQVKTAFLECAGEDSLNIQILHFHHRSISKNLRVSCNLENANERLAEEGVCCLETRCSSLGILEVGQITYPFLPGLQV